MKQTHSTLRLSFVLFLAFKCGWCKQDSCNHESKSNSIMTTKYPVVGPESLMAPKAHGTCEKPVQATLRYNVDVKKADEICCYNRHYAEHSGYFTSGKDVTWLATIDRTKPTVYYDSVSGKPLFEAPKGRTFDEFLDESKKHGWPSFRDEEVNWDNVRTLENGETVSLVGTHLGHNLPDGSGNRYCINLISCAGNPE
eukprot:m.152221 g.152221  ORF g.152221 m.152221 type:complete len:197 (+) comp30795_c7_seq2:73-663(+)